MREMTWACFFLLAACGTSVKGSAHIVRGSSAGAAARTSVLAPTVAGHWLLSPNASTVTITQLQFRGDNESQVDLASCKPSYQRDAAELTSILDCDFEVDTGSYTSMTISVAGEAQVSIDDPTNGLFTDPAAPSKLVTTAPAGGAQPVTVTLPTAGDIGNSIEAGFIDPLVVAEGQPVSITILEDMIHTMAADVNGTTAAFDLSLPLPPVFLIATADAVTSGTVEYYAPSGSADNWTMGGPGTGNEAGSARFFFVNGKPQFVWHVVIGSSEAWASDPRGKSGSRTGGYLGLDSTGTLCWAHTMSDSLSWPDNGYAMLCRMPRATNLGEVTTIGCTQMSNVPPPTSGSTYESGCPAFTPTMTQQVTLVAR
jgi:hypothetical protein